MELTDKNAIQPFLALMDEYDKSFYDRNIDKFRSLYVADDAVVYFDNHADCDSNNFNDHERKITDFFRNGNIVSLLREQVRVFVAGEMACITAILRYSSCPSPGVRTTYVLERDGNNLWKIRHVHYSSDPNEAGKAI